MKTLKISLFSVMLGFCMTIHFACSHDTKTVEGETPTALATEKIGGHRYVEIDFAKGAANLTEDDKVKLQNISDFARNNGSVEKIRVLAWSDKEYPSKDQKVLSRDVKLADSRAERVKDFIADNVGTSVEVHNMAKRPSALSELFNTEDTEVKDAFVATGAAPVQSLNKDAMASNKASKALVILSY